MKISELPEVIKIKAIKYRGDHDTDDLGEAFGWDNTLEGEDYWYNLHNKKSIKTESLIYTFANEIKEEYPEVIIKTDPIVDSIINKFSQRSKVGIEKYGTTLKENNKDNFLKHLQEELMDAILYIEKLQDDLNIAGKMKF